MRVTRGSRSNGCEEQAAGEAFLFMESNDQIASESLISAEHDLSAARDLANTPGGLFHIGAYVCQQAAEKSLKAFLAFSGQEIPRTRDLRELLELAAKSHDGFRGLAGDAELLHNCGTALEGTGLRAESDHEKILRSREAAKHIFDFVSDLLPDQLLTPSGPILVEHGIHALGGYIEKLLHARRAKAGLIGCDASRERCFGLISFHRKLHFGVSLDWRRVLQEEARVRQFFAQRGIAPAKDYFAGNGSVPDATRVLEYPLARSTESVCDLIECFLREVYGITDGESMRYHYQEYR